MPPDIYIDGNIYCGFIYSSSLFTSKYSYAIKPVPPANKPIRPIHYPTLEKIDTAAIYCLCCWTFCQIFRTKCVFHNFLLLLFNLLFYWANLIWRICKLDFCQMDLLWGRKRDCRRRSGRWWWDRAVLEPSLSLSLSHTHTLFLSFSIPLTYLYLQMVMLRMERKKCVCVFVCVLKRERERNKSRCVVQVLGS